MAFATLGTGLMLNQDISSGVFGRFRSLPIARWAPLAGAVLGDMVRYLISVAITIAAGMILGFRVTTNPISAVAACLLLLAFALAMCWVSALIGMLVKLYGVAFAEQGFHVLLQSCRGTGGSTGRFEPFRNEAADGQATVAWLRGQDWFTGRLGTIGASYLGYVQLALAADPPPELKAAVVQVGLHDPAAFVYPGGVFALGNVLSATAATFSSQGILRLTRALVHLQLHFKRAARILPIKQACRQAPGEPVAYLEQWLDHEDPGDTLWQGLRVDLARWPVPTALQGGWYDAVLDQTLAQYAELKANGCEVSLLVGPWSHSSAFTRDGLRVTSRQALAWMTERLAGDGGAEDKPGAPGKGPCRRVGAVARPRSLAAARRQPGVVSERRRRAQPRRS